ncbi:MAG: HlyD family efflux transporter periplasmic adaptor subunit [Anaerolineae bacterium]|nr:HlyD family efflux transporter periplasmic adaptor subunit [Anaerolineae bacterium]MDW8171358.1 HlyD family efflux transporter periplasmic adaptor subunit [Anaerolineae bacterium]
MNIIIYLVVTYMVYRLLIVPIRWRLVRVLLYAPIMTGVALAILYNTALDAEQSSAARAQVESRIVDRTLVERGDLVVSVTSSGTVQPLRQVALRFALSAPVMNVYAEVGQRVRAGDVIAELDAVDLSQAIQDARVALEAQEIVFKQLSSAPRDVDIAAAQAALAAARAQYNAATQTGTSPQQVEIARLQTELARIRNWQTQLQRDQVQRSIGSPFSFSLSPDQQAQFDSLVQQASDATGLDLAAAISGASEIINQQLNAQQRAAQMQLDQLNLALVQTEQGIQLSEAQFTATANRGPDLGALAGAQAAIVQAEVALERLLNGADELQLNRSRIDLDIARLTLAQAEDTLSQSRLIAPFDGLIAQNNLRVGELPPQQNAAVLLVDNSGYLVDLPIDETDVVRLRVGQLVRFTVDALPDAQVTGVVERIAYTPLRVGQLVTYTTRVRIDPTDAPLRVGMSVTADVIVKERPNTVLLRNRFIRIDRVTRDAFVTVYTPQGGFEERMILLGERGDVFSEVLSGLQPDEEVVLVRQTQTAGGLFGG